MKRYSILLASLVLSVLTFAAVLDDRFNAAFGPLFPVIDYEHEHQQEQGPAI